MNLALVDVVIATAAAVCVGVAFTVWKFKAHPTHDHATTELLKHFFDGKACAICKRPIPPVHGVGLKPGLMDPATKHIHSWVEIPNVDIPKALETHVAICSECEVAESFRQRFPNLVTDGDRSVPEASSHH